jgi:hypothetical protein
MAITVAVTSILNNVTVSKDETVIQREAQPREVVVSTAIPRLDGSVVTVTPTGTVTATTVQGAIEQLAGQDFRQTDAPTGSQVSEGDLWYDTDDNQLKMYRETSANVFQWVSVILGDETTDSDTLDAGSF